MPRVRAWFWFWFSIWMHCVSTGASLALKNITAEVGQNVPLPCKVLNNKTITAVAWTRPGLDPDCVLLYRDGHLDPDIQHPSYENRVDLQDREMKDGDVSLILKNVTKNDTGRYKCRVFQRETNARKRSILKTEPISIINLDVLPPGGEAGIIVGSVVGVILLLAVASVGFLIYRREMKKKSDLPVPPDEAALEQMLEQVLCQQQNKPQSVTLSSIMETMKPGGRFWM